MPLCGENSLQILGFLGWVLFSNFGWGVGGLGGGVSCSNFSSLFVIFLFLEGVMGSILAWWVGEWVVAHSSARFGIFFLGVCSAWPSSG